MSNKVHFLLVEDDDIDIMAMKRLMQKAGMDNEVHVAHNGFEALAMLRGEAGAKAIPRPFIILLDLNMPQMNGLEFLNEVRRDETLHDSIVFIITTSNDPVDIKSAYEKNIAGYIVKTGSKQGFERSIHMLAEYQSTVCLPPANTGMPI